MKLKHHPHDTKHGNVQAEKENGDGRWRGGHRTQLPKAEKTHDTSSNNQGSVKDVEIPHTLEDRSYFRML